MQGFRTSYPPGKRVFPRWRWTAVLILALSPLLLFAFHQLWILARVEGGGVLQPEHVELTVARDAWIDTTFARPGDLVDSGAPLLAWSVRPALADDGSGGTERGERLRIARIALALVERREAALREVFAHGAATSAEVAEAELATLRARGDLVAFENDSLSRARPETADAEHGIVRAPRRGRILSMIGQGARNVPGRPLVAIAVEPSTWNATGWFAPRFLECVRPGRDVSLRLPDGMRLAGRIERVAPAVDTSGAEDRRYRDDQGGRLLEVRVRLLETLPVHVRIEGLPVAIGFWRFVP